MDALGIKPVVSQPVTVRSAAVLPSKPDLSSSAPTIQVGGNVSEDVQSEVDSQAAEQSRMEALVRAAQSAPQPLGSQVFTIFKDATGQYITQFRDTNTGVVTSIPEPQMLSMSAGKGATLVNIQV